MRRTLRLMGLLWVIALGGCVSDACGCDDRTAPRDVRFTGRESAMLQSGPRLRTIPSGTAQGVPTEEDPTFTAGDST